MSNCKNLGQGNGMHLYQDNLSKMMFKMDEELMKDPMREEIYNQNLHASNSTVEVNAIKGKHGIGSQMNAYVNQANLAHMYKNWGTRLLVENSKYGMYPLGGNISNVPQGSLTIPPLQPNEVPIRGYANMDGKYYPVQTPEKEKVTLCNNMFDVYVPTCTNKETFSAGAKKN